MKRFSSRNCLPGRSNRIPGSHRPSLAHVRTRRPCHCMPTHHGTWARCDPCATIQFSFEIRRSKEDCHCNVKHECGTVPTRIYGVSGEHRKGKQNINKPSTDVGNDPEQSAYHATDTQVMPDLRADDACHVSGHAVHVIACQPITVLRRVAIIKIRLSKYDYQYTIIKL